MQLICNLGLKTMLLLSNDSSQISRNPGCKISKVKENQILCNNCYIMTEGRKTQIHIVNDLQTPVTSWNIRLMILLKTEAKVK